MALQAAGHDVRKALDGRRTAPREPLVELDDIQRDALTELINVAFGRAAASLSKLTGHRVEIRTPSVAVCGIAQLAETLDPLLKNDIATVHQIFSGPVAGDALLILDDRGAMTLKELLTDEPAVPLAADHSARDVLTEIGNILLNACLGTLGNLLHVHVRFSVPELSVSALGGLLDSLVVGSEDLRYALVVHAAFRVRTTDVEGYLVIVLSVASLERLLGALPGSEERQA